MANLNLDFYKGEDLYSDGSVEDDILELVRQGKKLEDLSESEVNFPIVYHLSEVRENIISWYPFKDNASVLEIGGGCGAISGALCRCAAKVTSVELSKRRATINYERHKDLANLEIIVGNFNDIEFSEKFDYVVLNGVFEYAASFTEGETPYETFLGKIQQFIKDDGRILIAIENRLGAKYFAGAPEDHIDMYFKGLNQYEGIDSVHTFSKEELNEVCEGAGLICNKFYYPYPDYKFPYEIFTDETINTSMYGRPMFQFNSLRTDFIDEVKLNSSFAKEGVADRFANSFLVEIVKQSQADEVKIDYVKLNTDRNKEFKICTTIWRDANGKHVSKSSVGESAKGHILGLYNNSKMYGDNSWSNLTGELANTSIVYPFLKSKTLDDELKVAIDKGDKERCRNIFNIVSETFLCDAVEAAVCENEDFKKVFGEVNEEENIPVLPCVSGANIDLILDNIFAESDKYTVIDTEWIFPFNIPTAYIMWRVINEAYYKHNELYKILDKNELSIQYGITDKLTDIFRKWEIHFAYEYVGSYQMQKYSCDILRVDINGMMSRERKHHIMYTSLSIDTGNGYEQGVKLEKNIDIKDGKFEIEYELKNIDNIENIRWDPQESACICRIDSVETDRGTVELKPINCVNALVTDGDLFLSSDPCYNVIISDKDISYIKVSGRIDVLYDGEISGYGDEVSRFSDEVSRQLDDAKRNLQAYQNQAREKSIEVERLNAYINQIHSSKLWIIFRAKNFAKRVLRPVKRKVVSGIRRIKNRKNASVVIPEQNLLQVLENTRSKTDYSYTTDEVIDVIVPIYNGYDYLLKLFPTIEKTGLKHRVFLVDDCSPDTRVKEIIEKYVTEHDNAVFIQNPENYGFVKSVNNALCQTENHVALVNTDTELPDMWLERLMKPILFEEKVGSTTPYSNSATIFSFPNFCYNNEIYRDLSVDEVDAVFSRMKPRYVEAPTGVGFCMGMNKYAIKEIGTLDYETFSKGFGEENDWCQRAISAGYKNVQVENLFVYHKHGGSFMSEEKEALLKHNVAVVEKRYPNYNKDVHNYICTDANKDIREVAKILLDMGMKNKKSILAFDHSIGGGATSYLEQKVEIQKAKGNTVTVIRYDLPRNIYKVIIHGYNYVKEYKLDSIEEIENAMSYLDIDEVYLNEIVTYPFIPRILNMITNIAKSHDAKLIMLFHDYFPICPTINLTNTNNIYCGFPDEGNCNNCFKAKQCDKFFVCDDVKQWRNIWRPFLEECDEVRTFSEDTLQRVKEIYGDRLKLTLVPHKVEYLSPINKKYKTSDSINIGLMGTMTVHKGQEIVKKMLEEIERRGINAKIILIGENEDGSLLKYAAYRQTGRYNSEDLIELTLKNDIDVFLIPSVWPETFSYTTEEVIQMNMPVASFDIGAPAERIRKYQKGIIIPDMNGSSALDSILKYYDENNMADTLRNPKEKVVFVAEYISFSSRYRAEHMQEELLVQGMKSELWTTDNLPRDIQWDEISKIVVYRCRYHKEIQKLLEDAKQHNIEIIYEIDDYIFDYDAIADLPFMKDEEYKNFKEYSEDIYRCMEKCDRFTTSTDCLAEAIKKEFPDKEVFVNRNVASSKMMILSAKARVAKRDKKSEDDKKKVVLGYFSGSHTHNGDFELISDVLIDTLDKHPEVSLKIVGCLELDDRYKRYSDRIERIDFMDWKKLPETIASIDINLMPLEDTFFHACKSENKWMEAAYVGVPTIASSNIEMKKNTRDEVDILLCSNKKEWMEKLSRLVEDEKLRNMIAENALQRVLKAKSTLYNQDEMYEYVVGEK